MITDEQLAAHAESKRFLLKILAAASAPTDHVNAAKEQLSIAEELIERRRAAKKEKVNVELISDDEIERIAMQMTAAWMVECWKDGRTPSQEGQVEFFGDFWDAASMAANIRARWRAERQSSSPRSIHYDARMAALDVVAYYAAALVGVPGVVPPKGTESMSQTEIRARLLNALLEVPEMPKE